MWFNEGYSASHEEQHIRYEFAEEAIRLGRLLAELLPSTEVLGLLALMLIQHSRHNARVDSPSPIIVLNRAVAIAHRDTIEDGLNLLKDLEKELKEYYLFHAARADFFESIG